MRRLTQGTLPPSPRIALIANDSLGNYVISTVVAQMIRRQYPDGRLTMFSGERVSEFTQISPLFHEVVSLYGPEPGDVLAEILARDGFDWTLNLEHSPMAMAAAACLAGDEGAVTGPCLGADGRGELAFEKSPEGAIWEDREWISDELVVRHPTLGSGFIGEILARSAYLTGEIPGYALEREEPGETPDVLIATAASLATKLWPVERWIELVRGLAADGMTIGLVGAKPSDQSKFWQGADDEGAILAGSPLQDLRGVWTLPQVVGAIDKAKLVVTLDNGVLHLACATQTPVVGLFRHGIHRLWAPPVANLRVLEPGPGGSVSQISTDDVWSVLKNFQMPLAYF